MAKARDLHRTRTERSTPKAARRRVRREPEDAKETIFAAARAIFSERGPTGVTVRDIARRAKVSHGLITHYFGSYEGLVRLVLARLREAALASLVERMSALDGQDEMEAVLDLALAFLMDPARRRLRAWLDARGTEVIRLARLGVVTQIATLHINRIRASMGRPPFARPAVEDLVHVLLAATQGFSPDAHPIGEARFRETLKRLVILYVGAP
jgi:AcrR family transcriptional regulator